MKALLAIVGLCVGATAMVEDPPAEQPAFEVASIKASPTSASPGSPPASDPLRLSIRRSTLRQLIQRAYSVEDYQITGGPGWAETDRYDVDARPASPVGAEQLKLMLQGLLKDRFQLMLHFETRPVLLNVLTLAKRGPRFSATFHAVQDGEPSTISGKPQVDHIPFAAVTMKTFTTYLRMNLARDLASGKMSRIDDVPPVFDKTELAGKYDIVLFAPPNDDWQALLERQLGLRLEEKKVPTQIVVIDQAVRPTDN